MAILTNEQPINIDDLSVDIDMKDVSRRGPTSSCDPKMGPEDLDELREDDGKGMEFPTPNLYELEQRGLLCEGQRTRLEPPTSDFLLLSLASLS